MKILKSGNGIKLVGEEDNNKEMDYEYSYNKGDIPDPIIEECDKLYKETGLIHFIFDTETKGKVSSLTLKNKNERREFKIESILGDEFYISNEDEFNSMPSRYSLYDTETNCIGRHERYNKVLDFIKKIGFKASNWNLGLEYEQTFSIENKTDDSVSKWTLRLKPNMFLTIEYFYSDKSDGQNEIIYDRFFNRSFILRSLLMSNKSFFEFKVRDIKLDNILY